MQVEEFINQLSVLGKEELDYKRLWEERQLPLLPVRLGKRDGSIADITLEESRYFPDGKSCFHISKHLNYLPCYIHNHEFLEIEVVMRGRCVQEMNGRRFTLEEGDVIMVSPKQYHAVSVYDDTTVLVNMLIPRRSFGALFSPFEQGTGIFSRYVSSLAGAKRNSVALCLRGCQEIFPVIAAASQEGGRSTQLDHALALEMLALLALRDEEQCVLVEVDEKSDARMGAILHYIRQNPDKVSLKTLSYAFAMTPAYMSALIHKSTGSTFIALLTKRRMEIVLQLLEHEPGLALSQIAKEVGYESVQQLCRVFRSCYHLSPTEYRRTLSGKRA